MGQRCPSALEMMDWNSASGEASIDVWSLDGGSPAWALSSTKMLSSNAASQTIIPNLKQQNGFGFIFFQYAFCQGSGAESVPIFSLIYGSRAQPLLLL